MTRATLTLVLLAACDLGIGSDPDVAPCLRGNLRTGDGCFVPRAMLALDGRTEDWAAIAAVPVDVACVTAPCAGLRPTAIQIAAGGPPDGEPGSLNVRVVMSGPPALLPDLRFALALTASSLRPATAGTDRLILEAAQLRYEKNGYAVGSRGTPPYGLVLTPDGFEASIDDAWLTYQGAGQLSFTAERQLEGEWRAIAPIEPMLVCWSFRESLGRGCEAVP
jgi:hypothetical protein